MAVDRKQVAALITMKYFLSHHSILGQSSPKSIAVSQIYSFVVNIRLNDKAVTHLKAVPQVFPYPYHGQGYLMAWYDRISSQVSALNTGVSVALGDQLDIGKTETYGVRPNQKFLRAIGRPGQCHRPAIPTKIIQTRS
jgi:hypothetical protein